MQQIIFKIWFLYRKGYIPEEIDDINYGLDDSSDKGILNI